LEDLSPSLGKWSFGFSLLKRLGASQSITKEKAVEPQQTITLLLQQVVFRLLYAPACCEFRNERNIYLAQLSIQLLDAGPRIGCRDGFQLVARKSRAEAV
jgi:hypothetical protein